MTAGGHIGRRLLSRDGSDVLLVMHHMAHHLQHEVLNELPHADRKIAELVLMEIQAAISLKTDLTRSHRRKPNLGA
jgi:hypothetical protein